MIRCLNKSYLEGGRNRPRLMLDLTKKQWSLLLARRVGCLFIFVVWTVFMCCMCSDTFVGCFCFCLYPSRSQRDPVCCRCSAHTLCSMGGHQASLRVSRTAFLSFAPHNWPNVKRKKIPAFTKWVLWFWHSWEWLTNFPSSQRLTYDDFWRRIKISCQNHLNARAMKHLSFTYYRYSLETRSLRSWPTLKLW